MSESPADRRSALRRREPPPLVPVEVAARHEVNPRLLRLTLAGPAVHEMAADLAASVRLLVPSPGSNELVMPSWDGNEFLLPSGERPALRTFTPLPSDEPDRLDVEIVRHHDGAVSSWAETVTVGSRAAISGPGRGFERPATATTLHLLGDETAVPAISQLLSALPHSLQISVHAEVESPLAMRALPEHRGATIDWAVRDPAQPPGHRLVAAATELPEITATTHVWAAGEAASMQAIRTHLFNERDLARPQATIRGYWKPRAREQP